MGSEEVITPSANMLEQIRTLTDVGAMTRLLHECIAYERSIDNELEALLEDRHGLEKKLAGLYQSAEVLEFVRSDAEQMLRSVSSTCDLADDVSGKVRELDLAQSRVQSTLTRIDAIVDCTNCIDGAKQARPLIHQIGNFHEMHKWFFLRMVVDFSFAHLHKNLPKERKIANLMKYIDQALEFKDFVTAAKFIKFMKLAIGYCQSEMHKWFFL